MLKHLIAILLITTTIFSGINAQEDWTIFKKREKAPQDTVKLVKQLDYSSREGKVVINQDNNIDSLISKIARAPFINGYTVQIEVSQQKSVIRDARYKFLKKYPDVPLDDKYNAPNTYLYGGRFYDKNSAYEFKHKVRSYFPDAIVIQMKMDLPPLSSEPNK